MEQPDKTLNSLGFYKYHQCHCGGTLKQSYQKDSLSRIKVTLMPERKKFRIKTNGSTINGRYEDFKTILGEQIIIAKRMA